MTSLLDASLSTSHSSPWTPSSSSSLCLSLWYILHSFSDILWFTNSLFSYVLSAVKSFHWFIDFDSFFFFHSRIFIWFFLKSLKKHFQFPTENSDFAFHFFERCVRVHNCSFQCLCFCCFCWFSLKSSRVPGRPSQSISVTSAKGRGLWWWLAWSELQAWESLDDLVDANYLWVCPRAVHSFPHL